MSMSQLDIVLMLLKQARDDGLLADYRFLEAQLGLVGYTVTFRSFTTGRLLTFDTGNILTECAFYDQLRALGVISHDA